MFEALDQRAKSLAQADDMYGLNTWLAHESEFYPVFGIAVTVPDNSRTVDFQVEVSYNLAFRGVQAMSMPADAPLPASVAPIVATCSASTGQVHIEAIANLQNAIIKNPDGQDANFKYKTFIRARGSIGGTTPEYGALS